MRSEAELTTAGSRKREKRTQQNVKLLNRTIMNITGRLTRDAEIRTTSQDKQVVSFSVAVNDSYRNRQGERIEQAAYFDCSYWITPNVARFLTKGTLVELSGRVSTRAWMGNDGAPRAGLNFHTSQIKLHGSSRAGGSGGKKSETAQTTTGTSNNKSEDDLPF